MRRTDHSPGAPERRVRIKAAPVRRVLVLAAVALLASCRPPSEIRPAFTKERVAPASALRGLVVYTGRERYASRVFGVDLSSRAGVTSRISPTTVEERSPALSPDGRTLATAVVGRGDQAAGIFVRPVGGGGLRRVIAGRGVFDSPTWSPDGKRIAFARVGAGTNGNWDLWVVGRDGKGLKRLTQASGQDWDPAWSPQGDRIAFTSDRDGDSAIWTIDLGSRSSSKLVDGRRRDEQPAWSPDGRHIVFSSDRELETWQLFTVDPDTGKQRRLLKSNTMDRYPAYSPDGRYVLVSVGYLAVYRADCAPTDPCKFPDGADRWKLGRKLALSSAWTGTAPATFTGAG